MQAHKISSYNTELSSSNTNARVGSCVERKVEMVKGKAMLKSVVNKLEQKKTTKLMSSNAKSGQFDFAGLAG